MSEQQNQNQNQNQSVPEQTPPKRQMSDIERQKARQKRNLAFKKKQQILRDASPEDRERMYHAVHQNYEKRMQVKALETAPTTFRAKWENYWYHYKVPTIIAIILVVFVGYCVYSVVTKEKYDLSIMFVSAPEYQIQDTAPLEQALTKYTQDYDSNGEVNVTVDGLTYDPDGETTNMDYYTAVQARFTVSFSEGLNLVYIMDETIYDLTKNTLHVEYEDLSQYSDNPNIDGEKYYIKDDDDFSAIENRDGLVLVIRKLDNLKDKDKEETISRHAQELEVVKQIIAE